MPEGSRGAGVCTSVNKVRYVLAYMSGHGNVSSRVAPQKSVSLLSQQNARDRGVFSVQID